MLKNFTKSTYLLAATTLLSSPLIFAQGNQAIVTGIVKDQNKEVIIGAVITVKNEATGFSAVTVTNENGEYTFKQLPLGDNYSVTMKSITTGEEKKMGYALNQGDQVVVNFDLKNNRNEIKEVQIIGNSLKKSIKSLGAATAISANDLSKMPVNGRNFTSLMDLSPLSNGTSIGGQLASSNNYTVDGMTSRGLITGGSTSAAYSISMEAIREFKVVTNEYDVTNGREGGGTVSTVTKSGTNQLKGSVFGYGRTGWLSSPYDIRGNERLNDFNTYQYGFSLAGPIVKDRAHFFITWDRQSDARPLYIAAINSPADEKTYNVTQSTLDKYLSIARDKYGVSDAPQFGTFNKKKSTDAVFARVDWQLNSRNLLTLTNNFVSEYSNQDEGDNSGINLYESYIDRKRKSESMMVSLRTQINPRITNELKGQFFYNEEQIIPNDQLPNGNIPRAIVENITSTDEEGKSYTTSIQLGGQRFAPEWFKGSSFQLVDNLYYNTEKVKYTFGVDVIYNRMHSRYGSEMNGRFYYTGLENFENNTPYRYAREIYLNNDDQSTSLNSISSAAYGQMETTLTKGINMMAGIRLDNVQYLNGGNYNEAADRTLGLKTDVKINTFQLQPRIQFTWNVGERNKDIIRVGGGIFSSNLNPYSMINNMVFDGTKVASVDLTGSAVPTSDFAGYREDPSKAPGTDLFNNPNIEKLITINANSENAKVPVLYKFNASYNHFFNDRFRVGFNAYANLARNNYMYIDKNMVDNPYFTIDEEGGRGVFVPANSINTKNGSTNWVNGRKTNELGRVLEMVSEGKKNQFAMVVDGTYRYGKDGQIAASYTWNDSKDNTSYNGNVANTATLDQMVIDDPRSLSKMNYSNTQFRSKAVVTVTTPAYHGFSASLRFSGISGTRYSLAVSGNVNGDFVSSNDLAYIYDPNNPNTPEYLKTGIESILNNDKVEQSMKDYITKSFGKVAERNGGINGFYGNFDLRIAKKFNFKNGQGVELTADLFNLGNLISKDWGVKRNLGKQNIYAINGFDATEEVYKYKVSASTGISSFSGTPWQAQVGLRYSF